MKKAVNSSGKLTQSKITAFCSSSVNIACRKNRKRKNELEVSEVHKSPFKRAKSPDLFCSPETSLNGTERRKNEAQNYFENFDFDDFENDPFLSPKKKNSQKKNILAEDLSQNEIKEKEKSEMNFETPVRCEVIKASFSTEKHFEQTLILNDETLNKVGICKVRDVWTSCPIFVGDVVCIQAGRSGGDWVVDNKNGYLVLYPDNIISSTTLTCSMFCLRQGLLSRFFKEIDFEKNSKMMIGRLIHELFQESLKTTVSSDEDLYKIANEFMQSRDNLTNFFLSNMEVSDIQKEMKNFIPRIRKFLDIYLNNQSAATGKNFQGTISDVIDIEELIKSPTLGCQGRIDVTVKVKSRKGEKIAPLELKTGRASFSAEHRSQVVLYILLMNELGRKVESGLLLYLREEIFEEILPQRDEIRNLLLLRNYFVRFARELGSGNLPEPIRNVKSCSQCSYLRICTTYLRGGKSDFVSESHPLKSIEIPDVKPSHVNYFLRWSEMLRLEFEEIFNETADDHELSELKLEKRIENYKKEFKHTFIKNSTSKNLAFKPGTFVHIMNRKNTRICTGQVVEVTDSFISVLTDRKLADFSDVYKFLLFKSKFLYFYLSNLGLLLNEEFKELRELIIDKREPRFEKNFDKTDFQQKCLKNLINLNKEQQKAILKSLLCQDYLLIKGPPGTGKTQTIFALIKILLALNKTVLIASHTHSSVDNILLRLEDIQYLRLGSLKSIHKEIQKNSFAFLVEDCSSVSDIKKLFDRRLIASTCMGIEMNFMRKMKFDFCIIDESSQVLQPEILRPLFCCKKFILVGDEDQLPPIVRNPAAKKLGMSESLFECLSSDAGTVRLRLQYRMNATINALANAITYGGLLECANEEVAKATLKISNREIYLREDKWIVDVLCDDLEKAVVFVDTSECFKLKKTKLNAQRISILESNIILRLISCLIKFGVGEENIGVITPFWDQITLINSKLEKENLKEIELNTVDQYQGRDKDVILFSCTKENQVDMAASELELLNDERRLTVAVTRAKHKLIIVGDKETVIKYKPFKKLINSMRESQFFCLSNGQKNFFWENFVK